MNKKLSIVIVLIIALAAVWFYKNKSAKELVSPAEQSDSADITKEVEDIDTGNVDSEFKEIDAELNAL